MYFPRKTVALVVKYYFKYYSLDVFTVFGRLILYIECYYWTNNFFRIIVLCSIYFYVRHFIFKLSHNSDDVIIQKVYTIKQIIFLNKLSWNVYFFTLTNMPISIKSPMKNQLGSWTQNWVYLFLDKFLLSRSFF